MSLFETLRFLLFYTRQEEISVDCIREKILDTVSCNWKEYKKDIKNMFNISSKDSYKDLFMQSSFFPYDVELNAACKGLRLTMFVSVNGDSVVLPGVRDATWLALKINFQPDDVHHARPYYCPFIFLKQYPEYDLQALSTDRAIAKAAAESGLMGFPVREHAPLRGFADPLGFQLPNASVDNRLVVAVKYPNVDAPANSARGKLHRHAPWERLLRAGDLMQSGPYHEPPNTSLKFDVLRKQF